MTTADDLTAVWEAARPVIEDAFFADTYSVTRETRVSDGRGGWTLTPATVESGRCSLQVNQVQGREVQVGGVQTVAESTYVAEFPWATAVVPTDAVTINGRAFLVTAVKREGAWGLTVIVELEERT